MRRLPVYLLIDTSGSMRGEAIASVNVGLNALISSLRKDHKQQNQLTLVLLLLIKI